MDSNIKLLLERAENELDLAKVIFTITEDRKIQTEIFHLDKFQTFYSSVISHSYYCIFYSAKAYLLMKGIKTNAPEVHKKTFELFKKFVENRIISEELLKIYEDVFIKAETLLGIFKTEKKKRGEFTYQRLAQANREPTNQSLDNAKIFFSNIFRICSKEE
ncbi:MAG: HEPN domain-containing protein [Nanoarchaeota archaeon]